MQPSANEIRSQIESLTTDRESLRKHKDADAGIAEMFFNLDGAVAALIWVLEGGSMFDPEDSGSADSLKAEANKRLLDRIADGR